MPLGLMHACSTFTRNWQSTRQDHDCSTVATVNLWQNLGTMFLFYFYFRKDPLVIGKFVVVLATQIESECDSLAHTVELGHSVLKSVCISRE